MMKTKAYIPLLLMGTALLMTTACSEDLASVFSPRDNKIRFTASADETVDQTTRGMAGTRAVAFEGTQPSHPLFLSTEVTQRTDVTRGSRVESVADLTSFGVSAIKASENVTDEQFAAATPDFFYNLEASRNGSDVFEIAQDYYWPSSSEKLWFYAYAPYGDSHVQLSDQDAGGAQKVSFTVDTNVANQVDLMTANAETTAFRSASGADAKSAVPLSFRHELTAIRFVIGEQWLAGSIKSVAIYNVHGKGTMIIGANDASKWVWKNKAGTNMAATDDFVLTVDKSGLSGDEDEEFIDDTDLYFLMIPQSFDDNDDAYIEVKYQDNSYEYTVTAPLKGQAAWQRNTTVTYAISSHELTKLKIGSIAWPDNSDWHGPKTAFASGDSIGLYVVDTNGTDIVHQNIKCTYNGSTWTVHHPQNSYIYVIPGRQYFFYYPYTPTPNSTYPVAGQGTTNTSAPDFFSHLISGWTPAALQNDNDGIVFRKQDLQVGKATINSSVASTIDATMTHQMNLAIITLGQKNINELGYERTFYWLDNNYSWVHSVSAKKVIKDNYEITASSTFGGSNRPWKNTSNNKYYFVFKPVADLVNEDGTEIEGLQSDGVSSDWSLTFKTTDAGRGYERTAESTRTQIDTGRNVDTKAASAYVLAVGDIFYSNGAISHSLITTASNSNYGTPVGLVFYTSPTSYDRGLGYTHGYVMALKRYNSGNNVANWCHSDYQNTAVTDVRYASVDAGTQWTNITTDLNGLKHCKTAISTVGDANKSKLTAIYAAMNGYASEVSVPAKTSGWYLPSIGQMYQWIVAFAGEWTYYDTILSDYTMWDWRSDNQDFELDDKKYDKVADHIATAVDNYASGKLGASASILWDSFFSNHLWSSTEHSDDHPFTMHLYANSNFYLSSYFDKGNDLRQVRPVLAF